MQEVSNLDAICELVPDAYRRLQELNPHHEHLRYFLWHKGQLEFREEKTGEFMVFFGQDVLTRVSNYYNQLREDIAQEELRYSR